MFWNGDKFFCSVGRWRSDTTRDTTDRQRHLFHRAHFSFSKIFRQFKNEFPKISITLEFNSNCAPKVFPCGRFGIENRQGVGVNHATCRRDSYVISQMRQKRKKKRETESHRGVLFFTRRKKILQMSGRVRSTAGESVTNAEQMQTPLKFPPHHPQSRIKTHTHTRKKKKELVYRSHWFYFQRFCNFRRVL